MTQFLKARIKKTALYGLAFMASKWAIVLSLYFSGFWSYWFLLLFPMADSFAAIAAIIYLKGNFKKFFAEELEREFPEDFQEIIKEVNTEFARISEDALLSLKSTNPLDSRLKLTAYYIAFIEVLEARHLSSEQIKKHCLHVSEAYRKPRNLIHRWYQKMAPKFIQLPGSKLYLENLSKKVSIKDHPYGFRAHLWSKEVQNQYPEFRINILECGILNLLKKIDSFHHQSILQDISRLTPGPAGFRIVYTVPEENNFPGAH